MLARPTYDAKEKVYICNKCGEPWNQYGVLHGDMSKEEADKFLAGKGCPSCPARKTPTRQELEETEEIRARLKKLRYL